ncbi:MAG: FAD-binding oxidoreductase, partial [Thermoplasmata archaeon]
KTGREQGKEKGESKKEKEEAKESKPNDEDVVYKKVVDIVGSDRVSSDQFERILYSHDVAPLPKMMSLMFKNTPDLVVKPKNALEISKLMKYAVKNNIPIIPRGGGSWGLGGAVPTNGGILLDMGSLNEIIKVDKENLTITVEPGVSWKEVDDIVTSNDLFLGAYPSSAPGASVGGWINTGGIGIGSYKYGGVEQQIRSIEVVLPDGKIIRAGFEKVMSNSSGYNLRDLFVGSEGTLGIITKVTIKLHPAPEIIRPISFSFNDVGNFIKAISEITRARIMPWNITILDGNHLEYLRKIGMDAPEVEGLINVTFEGTRAVVNYEAKVLERIISKLDGEKMDDEFSEHEWSERYYELRSKAIGPTALVGEVFVPVKKLKEMFDGTNKVIKRMKIRAAIVGMISDRNTAVLMPYVLTDERKMVKSLATMAFIKKIGDLAFKFGGRPAGLGTFFSVNLKKLHGKGVETIFDIKTSIDPYDVMNPGKLTEGVTRFGVPIPALGFRSGMELMGVVKGILPKDK